MDIINNLATNLKICRELIKKQDLPWQYPAIDISGCEYVFFRWYRRHKRLNIIIHDKHIQCAKVDHNKSNTIFNHEIASLNDEFIRLWKWLYQED